MFIELTKESSSEKEILNCSFIQYSKSSKKGVIIMFSYGSGEVKYKEDYETVKKLLLAQPPTGKDARVL